jgi:hypothetical protein
MPTWIYLVAIPVLLKSAAYGVRRYRSRPRFLVAKRSDPGRIAQLERSLGMPTSGDEYVEASRATVGELGGWHTPPD